MNHESNGRKTVQQSRVVLTDFKHIQAKEPEYIWPGHLLLGSVNGLVGDPGAGKSYLTAWIAAKISKGSPWPDGTPCPQGKVIFLSNEDDSGITKTRLEQMGADFDNQNLRIIDYIETADGRYSPQLKRAIDLKLIAEVIREEKPILFIIDPVYSHMLGLDTNKTTDSKSVYDPLIALAQETGTCILLVTHMNKDTNKDIMYRAPGSIAFMGSCRAAIGVARLPDDTGVRVIGQVKLSYGAEAPGYYFQIGEYGVEIGQQATEKLKDMVSGLKAEHTKSSTKLELAKSSLTLLLDVYKDRLPANEAFRLLKDHHNIGKDTVRRAKKELGIDGKPSGLGEEWVWFLSNEQESADAPGPEAAAAGSEDVPAWMVEEAEAILASGGPWFDESPF